jgi:hypothetical protein
MKILEIRDWGMALSEKSIKADPELKILHGLSVVYRN